MFPYTHNDITNILILFVKPSVIQRFKSAGDFVKLDLRKTENLFPTKSRAVGFAAEVSLKELIQQDKVKTIEITQFRKDCLLFLTKASEKIFESTGFKKRYLFSTYGNTVGKSRCEIMTLTSDST